MTMHHPHGQIYAYPYVTPRTRVQLDSVRRHLERTGRNLYDDVVAAELADGSRVVLESEHWVAFVPFAARWPVEVHLYPRRRVPDLAALGSAERDDLARVYLDLLRRGDAFFGIPLPYIAAWHQAPVRIDRELGALHLRAVLDPAQRRQAQVPRRVGVGHGRLRERPRARVRRRPPARGRGIVTGSTAEAFARVHGRPHEVLWRAPGRVNLIGEHTDYNDGFVLPLALPLEIRVAAARRRRPRAADGLAAGRLGRGGDLARGSRAGAVTGWAAYVAGTAWALAQDGVDLPGADLLVDGEMPRGAGLSSSAALECATAGALLDLAGAERPSATVALLAQRAENDFVGMPCGVMDQFASTQARAGHLLLLDTRSLEVEHIPFDLEAEGLTLLVIDTRAPHRLVDGEYAARRRACEQAAALLGVAALRDVDDLDAALAALDDDTLRRRVRHVVTENGRVLEVVALLRAGDVRAIGPAHDRVARLPARRLRGLVPRARPGRRDGARRRRARGADDRRRVRRLRHRPRRDRRGARRAQRGRSRPSPPRA